MLSSLTGANMQPHVTWGQCVPCVICFQWCAGLWDVSKYWAGGGGLGGGGGCGGSSSSSSFFYVATAGCDIPPLLLCECLSFDEWAALLISEPTGRALRRSQIKFCSCLSREHNNRDQSSVGDVVQPVPRQRTVKVISWLRNYSGSSACKATFLMTSRS